MIHTGDLHIGQNLHRISRIKEHQAMLGWLHQQLLAQEADLLVISGDIFDYSLPTAGAQHVFYEFLGSLEQIPSLRSVIVTAGNHDSALRLQAISPVMKRIGIHIVGADTNQNDGWKKWLIPVKGKSGELEAVVAAVPFIHEFRLGIRMSTGSRLQHADSIRDAFQGLYGQFASWAAEEYPGLPLIGMGHLTAVNAEESIGFCPQQVHIALDKGLDGSIFDPSYNYVALGHIHKNYRIRGDANAYYCGSPLPCSIAEAEDGSTRGVWKLNFGEDKDERPVPNLLPIPCYRQLIRLRGEVDYLEEQIAKLEWSKEEESPMLWLEVETLQSRFDLQALFQDIIEELPLEQRPFVVKVENFVKSKAEQQEVDHEMEKLMLNPQEVFQRLLQTKGENTEDSELLSLFLQAYTAVRHDSQNNNGGNI